MRPEGDRTVTVSAVRPGSSGVVIVTLVAGGLLSLTGCAPGEPPTTPAGRQGVATATGATQPGRPVITDSTAGGSSCSRHTGFMLSLAKGSGWASPVQAAQHFTRQTEPTGYGTPSTVWVAGPVDASGVTLLAADVSLHAVRLPNGRWAIDSGQRCG
jgi:hypothetical protein